MQSGWLIPSRHPRGTALIVAMAIVMILAGLSAVLMNEVRTRSFRTEVNSEDVKSFEAAEAGIDAALRSLNTDGNGCVGLGWTDVDGDGKITLWEQAGGPNDGRFKPVANSGYAKWGGMPNGDILRDGKYWSEVDAAFMAPRGLPVQDKYRQNGGQVFNLPRAQPQEFNFYRHAVTFGDVRFFTYVIPWDNDGVGNDGNGVMDENDAGETDWFTIYSTGFSNPPRLKASSRRWMPSASV